MEILDCTFIFLKMTISNTMPKVQVYLCHFGLFGKLWNAGKYINYTEKIQEADLILHIGFAGVQELNVWAVFSFGEFLGRHLATTNC